MIEPNGAVLSSRDTVAESSTEKEEFSPDRMCEAGLMVAEAGIAR
jgi:hypothetical protein